MKHHTQQNNTKLVPMMTIHEQELLALSQSAKKQCKQTGLKHFKAHNKAMTTKLLQTITRK
jgi:hypothetical protein